jgi:2-methylisocitrate lyase-like PEP mutase family enzyme
VISNVEKLHHAGVAGINIEDSRHGNLELTEVFAEKIYSIKNHLDRRNMKMFVNARTDCFLLRRPDCVECALERIRAYEDAGADGVFVPFISDLDNIRQIVAATSLPVNVMYLPELPSFEALAACGVARISMGTFLFSSVYRSLEALTPSLYEQGSFAWS